MENISLIMWGLFGVMMLWVVIGLLAGLKRGWKRGLIRIGIFLVFMLIAVLLTPPIARGLAGAGFIQSMFYDMDMGGVDIASVIAPVVSLPLFMILYFVFAFLSWIAYAIVVGVTKIGSDPAKRGKGLGMLVGVVGGFIFFFFFMAPVNGLLGIVNTIDRHEPAWASEASIASVKEGEIFETISEANGEIQGSIYGFMTRITGMQALSRPIVNSLTSTSFEFEGTTIGLSITRDLTGIGTFLVDTLVILDNFDGDTDNTFGLPDGYFEGWQESIANFFDLSFMQAILGDRSGEEVVDMFTTAIEGLAALFEEDADLFDVLADLPQDVIEAVADILGLFTNDWILADFVRGFVADMMEEIANNEDTPTFAVSILEDLVYDLRSDEPVDWLDILEGLRIAANILGDIIDGEVEDIIEQLLSGSTLQQISENAFLSTVVVAIVEDVVNDMLDGIATITFGDESQEIVEILGDMLDGITDIIDGVGNLDEGDEFVAIFGDEPLETLTRLKDTGTTIELDATLRAEIEDALRNLAANAADHAKVDAILERLFGIE